MLRSPLPAAPGGLGAVVLTLGVVLGLAVLPGCSSPAATSAGATSSTSSATTATPVPTAPPVKTLVAAVVAAVKQQDSVSFLINGTSQGKVITATGQGAVDDSSFEGAIETGGESTSYVKIGDVRYVKSSGATKTAPAGKWERTTEPFAALVTDVFKPSNVVLLFEQKSLAIATAGTPTQDGWTLEFQDPKQGKATIVVDPATSLPSSVTVAADDDTPPSRLTFTFTRWGEVPPSVAPAGAVDMKISK